MAKVRTRNGITAALLFAVAGGMVGLSFASVPFYQWFCQVTGFGGTPKIAAAPTAAPSEKTITVRFDANVSPELPWRFAPEQLKIRVKAGEPTQVFYKAVNQSDGPITGTASFNVTPFKAARYFSKIDCFCFSEQRLGAGEEVLMGVEFFVDPGIFTDLNTQDVTAITLSYTFFRVRGGDDGNKAAGATASALGRPAGG